MLYSKSVRLELIGPQQIGGIKMKKLLVLLTFLFVISTVAALASDSPILQEKDKAKQAKTEKVKAEKVKVSKEEEEAFEKKIAAKAEQMRAKGASEEEINEFIIEAKKNWQAKLGGHATKVKVSKEELVLKKKIEEMKAKGASDEEIKKVIMDYKEKMKAEKEEQKKKSSIVNVDEKEAQKKKSGTKNEAEKDAQKKKQ